MPGLRLRKILRILQINIKLYGFIQSLSVLSTEKSHARIHLSKGWNREWDWVDYKKKRGPSNNKLSEGTSHMPTLLQCANIKATYAKKFIIANLLCDKVCLVDIKKCSLLLYVIVNLLCFDLFTRNASWVQSDFQFQHHHLNNGVLI